MSESSSPVDFDVCVVLPAGGHGARTGVSTPKQFWSVLDKPLIVYTAQEFNRIPWVQKIIVCVAKEYVESFEDLICQYHLDKVEVTVAGFSRHQSIFNGIKKVSLVWKDPDIVLVHDAVRPLINESIIQQVAVAAKKYGAAGIVNPLTSNIISVNSDSFPSEFLDRNLYHASEMPQGFKFDFLKKSYEMCANEDIEHGTECLHLVQKYTNINAFLIEGPPLWKVTFRKDYFAAEGCLKEKYLKVGLVNIPNSSLVSALKYHLEEHHIKICILNTIEEQCSQLTSVVLGQTIVNLDGILNTIEELTEMWTGEPRRIVQGGLIIFLIYVSKKITFSKTLNQLQKYSRSLTEKFQGNISPIFILTKDMKNTERIVKLIKSLLWEMSDTYMGQVFVL
ncbi:D-ribitol-5-phosphate cytidylyltransferase isoform X1 [Octopus vulgaris]|uniref:D-ribitol-5-phosphate cytidylyltransferase isoform X1 n=1 Tax=Octopus vulgaris TaxID=6645 RepID=A0AA36F1X5_OCTVU|nr:D-ribitol-5-phosphate cytidylyltransferase isoform X1 [Octopus vulgaris]